MQNGVISINTTKNNLKNFENIAIINCKVREESKEQKPFLDFGASATLHTYADADGTVLDGVIGSTPII